MPKGGVITLTARNATNAGADRVEIILRDTGTGIAREILDRIFEPYFTTKKLGQGTGLGLSQVYGFTKQSGGDVQIESQIGIGTSVILAFPSSREALSIPPPAPAPLDASGGDHRAVLMVEDDDNVAETVFAMLVELGHDVTRARSVDEALNTLAQEKRFDLVFSDIVMPGGKSGVELARALKITAPDLPVLLTSGYSGGEAKGTEWPLLRKPYQIHELRDALSALPVRRRA